MKVIFIQIILVLLSSIAFSVVSTPIVYDVSSAQRMDGSKIVDIQFSLYDGDCDTCTVSLLLSKNGGINFSEFPNPANLNGDFGDNVTSGTGKHIIWNAGADGIDYDSNQIVIRILANDKTINKNFGNIRHRLRSNTPASLHIKRGLAYLYFSSYYTLGGMAYRGLFDFQFRKNLGKPSSLYYRLFNIPEACVTNSNTFTNAGSYGGDDEAPLNFNNGFLGANHSYGKTSTLMVTYNGDIASHAGGDDLNGVINIDENYIAAINAVWFELIGKSGVQITIDNVDYNVVVVAALPALWNTPIASGRLKNVRILFYYGHDNSTITNWQYNRLSSGTVTGIKVNGNLLDLSLAHSTEGVSRSVVSYTLAGLTQTELDMYSGYGLLDWFYPIHSLTTRILSNAIIDNGGDNVLSHVTDNPAVNSVFSAAQNDVSYEIVYQIHNIYDLIEYIKTHRPYTFDQVAFNAASRNSGYYGNPIFNQIDVPIVTVKEINRYRGYNSIDITQEILFHNSIALGYIGITQTGAFTSATLPAGDVNAGKKYQTFVYVPDSKTKDKIEVLDTYIANPASAYSGKTIDRYIMLTAIPKSDNAARSERAVFFMSNAYNPVEDDTSITKRATNVSTNITMSPTKVYPRAIDNDANIEQYISQNKAFIGHSTRQQLPSGSWSDISKQATAVYWTLSTDKTKVFLYIDYHRDVTNSLITLPVEFANKSYRVFDSNNGVTIYGSSPTRMVTISVLTTNPNTINADGTMLITTTNTGDTVYTTTPMADTIYDLSGTTLIDDAVPITGIPDGNLAYVILEVY